MLCRPGPRKLLDAIARAFLMEVLGSPAFKENLVQSFAVRDKQDPGGTATGRAGRSLPVND